MSEARQPYRVWGTTVRDLENDVNRFWHEGWQVLQVIDKPNGAMSEVTVLFVHRAITGAVGEGAWDMWKP
jgi:hypothetical protein